MNYKKVGLFVSICINILLIFLILVGFNLYSYILKISIIQDRVLGFIIVVGLQIFLTIFIPAGFISICKEYKITKEP